MRGTEISCITKRGELLELLSDNFVGLDLNYFKRPNTHFVLHLFRGFCGKSRARR
jgi:hypothetical protein